MFLGAAATIKITFKMFYFSLNLFDRESWQFLSQTGEECAAEVKKKIQDFAPTPREIKEVLVLTSFQSKSEKSDRRRGGGGRRRREEKRFFLMTESETGFGTWKRFQMPPLLLIVKHQCHIQA